MQSTVLEFIVNKLAIQISTNSLTDIDFSQFSWLNEREPIYSNKGERISKSYYYKNEKETIRIEYFKIFKDYVFEGITYPNTFIGVNKNIIWIYWDGTNSPYQKTKDTFMFTLKPIYTNGVIAGFTSIRGEQILSEERRQVVNRLIFEAKTSNIQTIANDYDILFDYLNSSINSWVNTGKVTKFNTLINDTSNIEIVNLLAIEVEPSVTLKDYLISYIN
ncbi:MAG: hypothetical protein GW823_02620 [Bacteroidetes bacterium]|nr:hypothetical protein [Bacteroidota bacterium]